MPGGGTRRAVLPRMRFEHGAVRCSTFRSGNCRMRLRSLPCFAGGRAVDALRSITVAQHLFGIQNIIVVHHSHCGATSFTADGIIKAYEYEHHVDISNLYDRSNICITDYEASLKHDTALVRSHDGTPKNVDIFGYFYDIDTSALTEVVRDIHRD